ncbi:MAG: aldo/keto reductase [Proteobacteria bacterium]|nr:aldo/keto reductase [Pseudomonadota bacterium]
MERRKLFELIGTGAAALGMTALASSCSKQSVLPQIDHNDPTVGKMTYRVNSKNGDKISLLGFGCMRFPTIGDDKNNIDEEISQILVDEAIRRGVNYFDTAWPYHGGNSETFIGKALKKYPRDSFYLASKFPTFKDPTREEGVEIFNKQLEKCQVDYFDYYMLHALMNLELYKRVYEERGMLDYLLEQKKAGKIRNLGWSFHGNKELFEYVLSRDIEWDFLLVQINYVDWFFEPEKRRDGVEGEMPTAKWMSDKLAERNIPIIVMEPLLGGQLAHVNRNATYILKGANPNDTPAKWAFRFAGSVPNVLTILSGMTYMENLVENARTFSPHTPISDSEMATLEKAAHAIREEYTIPCTTCRYCMPCPYGIDIPTAFQHYNKCVNEKNIPEDSMSPDYAKARRAFLTGYDRVASDLRQADKCIGCKKCLPLCPQQIDIPAEMKRIADIMRSVK